MSYDRSKYLDDSGKRVVVGLFEEFDRSDRKFRPLFKLADWKQPYIESRDPSEYSAAMKLIGDWDHWQAIRTNSLISPIIDKWHQEMLVLIQSEAIKAMVVHSKLQGGTAAAKWLAENGWEEKTPKKRGRPVSKEVPTDTTALDISKDLERLGLIRMTERM